MKPSGSGRTGKDEAQPAAVSNLSVCTYQFQGAAKVLQSPGVLQIVGNRVCLYSGFRSRVAALGCSRQKIEPYRDLVIGEKVRIKRA